MRRAEQKTFAARRDTARRRTLEVLRGLPDVSLATVHGIDDETLTTCTVPERRSVLLATCSMPGSQSSSVWAQSRMSARSSRCKIERRPVRIGRTSLFASESWSDSVRNRCESDQMI